MARKGWKIDMKRSYTKWLVLFCLIGALAAAGTFWMERAREDAGGGIQVSTDGGAMITVSVTGEVNQPGEYQVPEYGRYSDAIYAAGGATERAYIDPVLLDKQLSDGDQVVIASVENAGEQVPDSGGKDVPEDKIDINAASKPELMQLPGVGEVTADRIIAYREEYGGFDRIEELMNVSGIGEKKFAEMQAYVMIAEQEDGA